MHLFYLNAYLMLTALGMAITHSPVPGRKQRMAMSYEGIFSISLLVTFFSFEVAS